MKKMVAIIVFTLSLGAFVNTLPANTIHPNDSASHSLTINPDMYDPGH